APRPVPRPLLRPARHRPVPAQAGRRGARRDQPGPGPRRGAASRLHRDRRGHQEAEAGKRRALSRRQYRAGATLAVLLAAVLAHAAGAFRVKLRGLPAAIAGTVSGMPGVAVVAGDGDYDMLVVQGDDGFRLTHPSGDPIASYEPARWPEVLKRISRQ